MKLQNGVIREEMMPGKELSSVKEIKMKVGEKMVKKKRGRPPKPVVEEDYRLENKIKMLVSTINKQSNCLREKDERICAIEKRWRAFTHILYAVCMGVFVFLVYYGWYRGIEYLHKSLPDMLARNYDSRSYVIYDVLRPYTFVTYWSLVVLSFLIISTFIVLLFLCVIGESDDDVTLGGLLAYLGICIFGSIGLAGSMLVTAASPVGILFVIGILALVGFFIWLLD